MRRWLRLYHGLVFFAIGLVLLGFLGADIAHHHQHLRVADVPVFIAMAVCFLIAFD